MDPHKIGMKCLSRNVCVLSVLPIATADKGTQQTKREKASCLGARVHSHSLGDGRQFWVRRCGRQWIYSCEQDKLRSLPFQSSHSSYGERELQHSNISKQNRQHFAGDTGEKQVRCFSQLRQLQQNTTD